MKFYIKPNDKIKVEKKINTLISKLSVRPTVTFSEPTPVFVKYEWLDAEGKSEKRKRRFINLIEVEVSEVFVNDWKLVANVSHIVNAMHIISYEDANYIPARYTPENTVCELCGKKHARRHTSHILYNPKTNRWMQVGTSCLHKLCDAGKYIASFADNLVRIIKSVDGFETNDNEGLKRLWSMPDHKDFDVAMDKYDLFYVAKKYYDTHKDWVKHETRRELVELFDTEVENDTLVPDVEFTNEVIDFINRQNCTTDFAMSVKNIANANIINVSDIGMVFWAIKMYFASFEKDNFAEFCKEKGVVVGSKYRVSGKCTAMSYGYGWFGEEVNYYHITDDASGLVFVVHTDTINKYKNEETGVFTFNANVAYISFKNREITVKGRLSKAA